MHFIAHGFASCILLLFLASTGAVAQDLNSYWPNQDGNRWLYDVEWTDQDGGSNGTGELRFEGTEFMSPGVEIQRLLSELFIDQPFSSASTIADPLLRRLAKFRPELRSQIAMHSTSSIGRTHNWPFLFLGPLEGLATDVGYRQTASQIGAWRDPISDWSWLYLQTPLSQGETFRLQLVPDLVDDLFLDGIIRDMAATINTPAGTFDNALVVDYSITPQQAIFTDTGGIPIGTADFLQYGWVAFVPDIGPVAMDEFMDMENFDCPACPPEADLTGAGSLRLTESPLPSEESSWGKIKAQF